jgi:hypothetical protein
MPQLSQAAYRFHPIKSRLDELPFLLPDVSATEGRPRGLPESP